MAQNLTYQPHKSSLGLDANLVALICYLGSSLLAFIPVIQYVAFLLPLVIYFVEKDSPFVKFHAIQSFVLSLICNALIIIFGIIIGVVTAAAIYSYSYASFGIISVLGILLFIIELVFGVLAIIALIKAWKYECYKIPLVGGIAEKVSAKFIK